jgi:hypothetical protein
MLEFYTHTCLDESRTFSRQYKTFVYHNYCKLSKSLYANYSDLFEGMINTGNVIPMLYKKLRARIKNKREQISLASEQRNIINTDADT